MDNTKLKVGIVTDKWQYRKEPGTKSQPNPQINTKNPTKLIIFTVFAD